MRFPKSLWSHNPIPGNCVLYLPLWSPDLRSSAFKSIDSFKHDITVDRALLGPNGRIFTGASNHSIDIVPTLTQLTPTTLGTILCWVSIPDNTPGSTQTLVGLGDANANEFILLSIGIITGTIAAALINAGTQQWLVDSDSEPALINNTFALVGVVQDGVSPVIYLNGVAIAQTFIVTIDKTQWFADLGASIDTAFIGKLSYNTAPNFSPFTGTIGEVWIYNRVLSAGEMAYIYSRTRGRYQ